MSVLGEQAASITTRLAQPTPLEHLGKVFCVFLNSRTEKLWEREGKWGVWGVGGGGGG